MLASLPSFIAHILYSRILGSFRDCKLETPLRKRRSRISITNEFSVKRQRISEAIGSIDVSTDAEQRQEFSDTNAEPRVSFCPFWFLKLIKQSILFSPWMSHNTSFPSRYHPTFIVRS